MLENPNKKELLKKPYGYSIYYTSNTASSSDSNYVALSISNCNFLISKVNNFGGSIYITFENDESSKQIEIAGCTLDQTTSSIHKNSVCIKSNKNANTAKFDYFSFGSCIAYFEAISSTIENCNIDEIATDINVIYYKIISLNDFEVIISVYKFNFKQALTVNSFTLKQGFHQSFHSLKTLLIYLI